jgi:cytochrome c biogenesis protein CcmG/thiol:disulfide interchange protein DsbE
MRFATSVFASFALAGALAGAMPRTSRAGETAPDVTVHTVDGKSYRMTDLKGRPVIIDFWATWCAPCKSSMPHLSAIQSRYKNRGLVVLGLSTDDDDPRVVRRFADRLGVTFSLATSDDQVLDAFGPIRGLPTTVYISRTGEIVRRVTGYIDAETMESYAKELLP